tara:strand:+ start:8564 stop:9757 length:1194 start_codon:yes stop_codon:yes gene_type:complete
MHTLILVALLLLSHTNSFGQTAASGVQAMDTPNDKGGSITLTWPKKSNLPEGARYEITVAESKNGPFHHAALLDASITPLLSSDPASFRSGPENNRRHFHHVVSYTPTGSPSSSIKDDQIYYLRLGLVGEQGDLVQARSYRNYFDWSKLNNFILGSLFSAAILFYIGLARRVDLNVRRLAGLEALDEALGRATEMGKPVLFVHGLHDMGSPSTIAAVNILGQVARRTAEFDTQLKVGNRDPIVMSVSQEVVKEAYIESGRPDAYNPDNVFLAAADQFSYAAALEGMMVREKPAANLLMGYFYAESLLLAETGSATGAIQIAATDAYTQLPFFVTTCDYTLMGEELYAASAYLSRDPKLLGSLKGQDLGKGIFILVLLLGTLMSTAGSSWFTQIFTSY